MKKQLAAILGALVLLAPAVSLADPPDRDDQGDQGNGHGHHSCVNPAGNERGWCKHNRGNCYSNNNGYPYPYGYATPPPGYPYPNQYGNCPTGYGSGYNATLHGVITSVTGTRISNLQGLGTVTFDASQAFQYGRVNGNLYPSRTITAQGYYDQGGYFHATQIS